MLHRPDVEISKLQYKSDVCPFIEEMNTFLLFLNEKTGQTISMNQNNKLDTEVTC